MIVQIQAELGGLGLGWTDITDDRRLSVPIELEYGIQGSSPADGVASTGELRFALDNSEANSAGLMGYYSPGHPNARLGFDYGIRVRLVLMEGGERRVKFVGVLDDLAISAGTMGERLVLCSAVDWFDDAARAILTNVPVQVRKRSNEVVAAVVAGMLKQPVALTINQGRDTFEFSLDDAEDQTALGMLQKVVSSEPGALLYIKGDAVDGGRLIYEGRQERVRNTTSVATFSGDLTVSLETSRNRTDAINRVLVATHPRRVDVAAVVIFELEKPVQLAPLETIVFVGAYTDPTQRAVKVGALESYPGAGEAGSPGVPFDAPEPVFVFRSTPNSSGVQMFLVSYSWVYGASEITFTAGNSSATETTYLVDLTAYAFGIYDYSPATIQVENLAAQALVGVNELKLDLAYQGDTATGAGIAAYMLELHGVRRTRLPSITIEGNSSEWMRGQALVRDISDRITVDETVTGIRADYFINAVKMTIEEEDLIAVTWTLALADPTHYFTLDESTFDGPDGLIAV